MNREILFRGFHPCENGKDRVFINGEWINGEWIEGAYITMHHNDGRTHLHHFIIPDNSDLSYGVEVEGILVEVIPETAGQYTGSTDKNDKKIFEGDILRRRVNIYTLGNRQPVGERMLIGTVMCDSASQTNPNRWTLAAVDEHGNPSQYYFDNSFEVIGNIHDNPELLEVLE